MPPVTAFQVAEMPASEAIRLIRIGLPVSTFDSVAKLLYMTSDQLAAKVGIPARTLRDQRKKSGRLSKENTEKLVRVARVQALGRKIFTTDEAVSQWLATPAIALRGAKPLDMLDTEIGTRDVENLLNGIIYGVVM